MDTTLLKPPIFVVTIRDDREVPIIYNCHPDSSGKQWVFISQMGNNYFAFDFGMMEFQSISHSEYQKYKENYYSLEVTYQTGEKNKWVEIPLTRKSKANKIPTVRQIIKMSAERDALELYHRTEQLLSDLNGDND
jgi:hypothetical protein